MIYVISLLATQLRVGENRLTVTGDKGYCMVRATHGTHTHAHTHTHSLSLSISLSLL